MAAGVSSMSQAHGSVEGNDLSGKWHESMEGSAAQAALQEPQDTPLLRYGFRVGGIGFLLAQEQLAEVAMDFAVYPMPHTEKWFAGMINMRGNLVPVFDIRMLLGISNDVDDKDRRRLLVLDSGEMAVGIWIDELPTTVNLDQPESRLPRLPDMLTKYIGEAFSDQGQVWVEFDIEAFFTHVGAMVSTGQCEQ